MKAGHHGSPATAVIPVSTLQPPDGPTSVVLVLAPPVTRASIPRLCDQVSFLVLTCDVDVVTCDLRAVVEPDATAIEALAKMQLTAKRLGRTIRLRHPCSFLKALLTLTGLASTLPIVDEAQPGAFPNG